MYYFLTLTQLDWIDMIFCYCRRWRLQRFPECRWPLPWKTLPGRAHLQGLQPQWTRIEQNENMCLIYNNNNTNWNWLKLIKNYKLDFKACIMMWCYPNPGMANHWSQTDPPLTHISMTQFSFRYLYLIIYIVMLLWK